MDSGLKIEEEYRFRRARTPLSEGRCPSSPNRDEASNRVSVAFHHERVSTLGGTLEGKELPSSPLDQGLGGRLVGCPKVLRHLLVHLFEEEANRVRAVILDNELDPGTGLQDDLGREHACARACAGQVHAVEDRPRREAQLLCQFGVRGGRRISQATRRCENEQQPHEEKTSRETHGTGRTPPFSRRSEFRRQCRIPSPSPGPLHSLRRA